MSEKTALVIITTGSEEMETVISVDVLRRSGIKVTLAGLDGKDPVKCSRSVYLVPDDSLESASKDGLFDAVVLPGGFGGSDIFAASPLIGQVLKRHEEGGKIIATICASALALKSHGVALGKKITSHPWKADHFKDTNYIYLNERVVKDGQFITSRSPGTAFEFAVSIVASLVGDEKAKEVGRIMLLKEMME